VSANSSPEADRLAEGVRTALQAILEAEGDGYQVSQFVVVMGLERFTSAGQIESTAWTWAPDWQPAWMTDGLLDSATEEHDNVGDDD